MNSLTQVPHGLDRDLKLLLFSMASRRVTMGFLQVVRAIYFALLGFTPLTIGLLFSLATVVSALRHVSFGVLSDRYGRKPFLLLGGIFAVSRLIIFAATRNFWFIALAQGLGAMGEGAAAGQPVVSGYIADKVELKGRISTFSILAITNAVAASIGSAMAGLPQLFQTIFGLDLVGAHVPLFLIGALLSALSFLLLLPIREVAQPGGDSPKQKGKPLQVKSWNVILKFSFVRSTSGLGWGLIGSMLPLYFYLRFAVGSDVLGPLYAASRLLSILTYLLIPIVVSRLGEIGTITLSRLLSASVTGAFALANSYPIAAVLLVTFRILMMFTMPIRQSFATGIVDQEETATAIGVSNFARMGVRSAAPTIAGYMFEAISLSMPLLLGSALIAVNGVLYHFIFGKKRAE